MKKIIDFVVKHPVMWLLAAGAVAFVTWFIMDNLS